MKLLRVQVGGGVEGAAPHMPGHRRLVDHLHPTAQTGQYNSIHSVQRERRQEENANSRLWQWGKKFLQKKFYSMWSPGTLLSLLLTHFLFSL